MSPILLTPAERDKFASWLEEDAKSDELILDQMEKNMGEKPNVFSMVANEKLKDFEAKTRIARQLRQTEDM